MIGLSVAVAGAAHLGAFDSSTVQASGCSASGPILPPLGGGTVTVPPGCTKVKVKLWGGGGSSWVAGVPYYGQPLVGAGQGGGGGAILAILSVSPGQVLEVVSAQPPICEFCGGAGGREAILGQNGSIWAMAGGGGGSGTENTYGAGGTNSGGAAGYAGGSLSIGSLIAQGGRSGSQGGAGGQGDFPVECWGISGQPLPQGSGGRGGCNEPDGIWGGGGGNGWFGGGGGAVIKNASGPYWSKTDRAGAGGGGAIPGVVTVVPVDGISQLIGPGFGSLPAMTDDPDYQSALAPLKVGIGGSFSSNQIVARGGRSAVMLEFGEDIVDGEGRKPQGWNFCPTIAPSPAPVVQNFQMQPQQVPSGCTASTVACRASYYDSGVICEYYCGTQADPVKYLFKAC